MAQTHYVGAVLDQMSVDDLRNRLSNEMIDQYIDAFPEAAEIKTYQSSQIGAAHGLEQLNHHCTADLKMRPEFERFIENPEMEIVVNGFGADPKLKVAAWRVKVPFKTKAPTPHITALCGPGGKVFNAGNIAADLFIDITPFKVKAKFIEVNDETIETNRLKFIASRISRTI